MKEKFANEKLKRNAYVVGAALLCLTAAAFVAFGLGPTQKKEKVPLVEVIDPASLEEESFKKIYGDRLFELERHIKELNKALDKAQKTKTKSEPKKGLGDYSGDISVYNPFPDAPEIDEETGEIIYPVNEQPLGGGLFPPGLTGGGRALPDAVAQKPQLDLPPPMLITDLMVIEVSEPPEEIEDLSILEEEVSKKSTIENTIPAGSFAEAVLLSGLDAPSGGDAMGQPHPVLMSLVGDTYLPNRWKTDIKECFVVGSGYGDMSTERAYIRAEKMSCVKNNGDILEKNIEGYVSGEDGKVGMAGLVVSKQGTMLLRTLVAGFIQGTAEAFQENESEVSIDSGGSVRTFDPNSAGSLAVFTGFGNAAEMLADFYMDLVNQMFPVVEINAGRKVTLIFLNAIMLDE